MLWRDRIEQEVLAILNRHDVFSTKLVERTVLWRNVWRRAFADAAG